MERKSDGNGLNAMGLKVVVVRPELYPETAVVEDIGAWFGDGEYTLVQAYTPETVIVAPAQKEGLALNRGLFDTGQTRMRQIVAGDFIICGVCKDGAFRSLTDQETYLYLERFRQPEKFLVAGSVIFCVPFSRRTEYASGLSKKYLGSGAESDGRAGKGKEFPT